MVAGVLDDDAIGAGLDDALDFDAADITTVGEDAEDEDATGVGLAVEVVVVCDVEAAGFEPAGAEAGLGTDDAARVGEGFDDDATGAGLLLI